MCIRHPLTPEYQVLVVRWDAILVLDLHLDAANGVRQLDIECDGLTIEGLHKDLHGLF